MRWHDLQPFAPGPPGIALGARVARVGGLLVLEYRLHDPRGAVRLGRREDVRRADRLWEHTCFEAFVAPVDTPAYWEVNLAGTGHWNVWRFAGYREGMAREDRIQAPAAFGTATTPDGAFHLSTTIDVATVPPLATGGLSVGLAAVLESVGGERTYWALRHAAPRPDFHARDGFAVRLGEATS